MSHVSKMWCCSRFFSTMGVSKNSGTPKCMVYNGKPFKMDDNLGYHHLRKHPYPWFGSHVPGQCLSNPPNLGPPSHSKPRQFVRQLLMLRALLGWSKFHRLGMKPHMFGEFPHKVPIYMYGVMKPKFGNLSLVLISYINLELYSVSAFGVPQTPFNIPSY